MPRLLALAVFFVSASVFAASQPSPAPALPHTLAGWTEKAPALAAAPDPGSAAVLREDGLAHSSVVSYGSGSNLLTVREWQFEDATGAYGAFTWFRQPQMRAEPIA